jgi:ABC-type antimicrobial peptide transport system permease subunit
MFTALNITGLAIGLSASWIMYQYVTYEFGYEAQLPNKERIYRVVSRFTMDGETSGNAGVPRPMSKAAAAIAGIEMAVPVSMTFIQHLQTGMPGAGGANFNDIKGVVLTDDRYFQLVPYRWLSGSPVGALSQPDQVVLTRSRAAKYFPGTPPDYLAGQTITCNDTMVLRISGVVADLDYPSSFIGQEFQSLSRIKNRREQWGGVNSSDQLFLLLTTGTDPGPVAAQINQISDANSKAELAKSGIERSHILQSMWDVHFDTEFTSDIRTANQKVLFILMGVAGFLLLLACINYINPATAQIPQRAREIVIRKTLGSGRRALLLQFLGETAVVTTVAVLLAGALTVIFFRYYGTMLPDDVLKFVQYGTTGAFLVGLIVLVSLIAGLYPGWLVTLAQPVRVLRGQVEPGRPGKQINLRKSLIVFQFFVAQLFLAGAVIVGWQLHYLMHNPLGFQKDAVVLLNVPWKLQKKPANKDKHFTMLEEIKKLPGVENAAMGEPLLNPFYSSNYHSWVNEKGVKTERNVFRKYADSNIIPRYEIPLLAGRNLLPSDTVREYVINETAVEAFGFASAQAAIGQFLTEDEGSSVPVVGVVSDFHTTSFSEKIEPTAFMTDKNSLNTLNIKLASKSPADWKPVLTAIEGQWRQFYPSEPFKCNFYDDTLWQFYEEENKLARLVNLATAVALLISCLGLFGLAAFMAIRLNKEIGIRKVLGASVGNVIGLLSKEFLVLVLISFVLSTPVVFYLLQKWLANYPYHVDIQWWMFLMSGATAIVIASITVSFQSIKAALANPVKSLRLE